LEIAPRTSHLVVMENKAGAIPIRMVIAMIAITKPLSTSFHLPRWAFARLWSTERRRKQATADLIHSSPHLLRDIGATEDHFSERYR
jgi:hypothetical protein